MFFLFHILKSRSHYFKYTYAQTSRTPHVLFYAATEQMPGGFRAEKWRRSLSFLHRLLPEEHVVK